MLSDQPPAVDFNPLDGDMEQALALSLAMANLERSPGSARSAQTVDEDLERAIQASTRSAKPLEEELEQAIQASLQSAPSPSADDEAADRAMKLALAESLKDQAAWAASDAHSSLHGAGPSTAEPLGSRIELAIDLHSVDAMPAPSHGHLGGGVAPPPPARHAGSGLGAASSDSTTLQPGDCVRVTVRCSDARLIGRWGHVARSDGQWVDVRLEGFAELISVGAHELEQLDRSPGQVYRSAEPPWELDPANASMSIQSAEVMARPQAGIETGWKHAAAASSASTPPDPRGSGPSRGWVCVCTSDELELYHALGEISVPSHFHASLPEGNMRPGEPLYILSRHDWQLHGGFEVCEGQQRAFDNGVVSVPFRVAREALVNFAVPLLSSGLQEVLGNPTTEACWQLEGWQMDAIEEKLGEVAAMAHAAGAGDASPMKDAVGAAAMAEAAAAAAAAAARDEEFARQLAESEQAEREAWQRKQQQQAEADAARAREIEHEEKRQAEREQAYREQRQAQLKMEEAKRQRLQQKLEDERAAAAAARERELELQRREMEAAERAAEQAERERRQRQLELERADEAKARELQDLEQRQHEIGISERQAQALRDSEQARALHVALTSACVECAPATVPTASHSNARAAPPRTASSWQAQSEGPSSRALPLGAFMSADVLSVPSSSHDAKLAGKTVIIDGLNVARSYSVGFCCPAHHNYRFIEGRGKPPPCGTAIKLAMDYFLRKGYRVEAFVPEWVMSGGKRRDMYAHEYELLLPYQHGAEKHLMVTPSGADDDRFILQFAQGRISEGEDVLIVSNDHYRDHIDSGMIDKAFMEKHAVKFMWARNVFMPEMHGRE